MQELQTFFHQFISHCKYEKNLSVKTTKAYESDFRQFIVFFGSSRNDPEQVITKLDKFLLRNYVELLMNNYKIKSVKRKVATLKAFLNFLEYEDLILVNPFRKMRLTLKEPVRLPKVMTLMEIKKIFKIAYRDLQAYNPKKHYTHITTIRDISVLELLFGTGVRVSELCTLKVDDVSLQGKSITVQGKGSKERVIHLCSSEMLTMLKRYDKLISSTFPDRTYFFMNRLGHRLSEQSVRYMINKYVKETNIKKKITPHTFRHTFATLLLEAGVDIKYIQHFLGHSSIMTTQIYTHVNKKKQKKILDAKHPRKGFSMEFGGENE
jgi:integrase/recombinase XerD